MIKVGKVMEHAVIKCQSAYSLTRQFLKPAFQKIGHQGGESLYPETRRFNQGQVLLQGNMVIICVGRPSRIERVIGQNGDVGQEASRE